jgi:hypothetical protein
MHHHVLVVKVIMRLQLDASLEKSTLSTDHEFRATLQVLKLFTLHSKDGVNESAIPRPEVEKFNHTPA